MIIGIPKEIKKEEYRVGMTPQGIRDLKRSGHTVLVEDGAGDGSGFGNDEYLESDADIVDRGTLFRKSELIVKVKEPLPEEYGLLKAGQTVFTYLHLAANRRLTEILIDSKIIALGYETLQKDGALPLLSPMSEIAGRMAPLMGAYFLQAEHGGSGVLPTGTAGVKPARALVLGAGVVGTNAVRVCAGLGMDTLVINKGVEKLQKIDEWFMGSVKTLPSTGHNIETEIREADIIICAVLVAGGKTPVLITRGMLKTMKKGAVIVDVSIDQGGCAETSKPTTHDNPIYTVENIIHYAVANMPGAYPRTSTLALTNATLPYIIIVANEGVESAIRKDKAIRSALNTCQGKIVHEAVADALGMQFQSIEDVIS
jgi:alanine dehydrogenase